VTSAPVVWGLHNSNLDKVHSRRTTRAIARTCALASGWLPARIVSCSEVAARIHQELGYNAGKIIVIPNGIDTDRFRADPGARDAVRRTLGLSPTALLVGIIARFDPQKDHRNFVRAAGILGERRDDVHFVLVGTGCEEQNADLMGWIRSTGFAHRFHLLGKRRDMPRVAASLDVAVLSSAYGEAFPLVIGEAMSCGVPCAVTDIGDSAMLVGDTGQVAPPGDPTELASAISTLVTLSAPERAALGAAARARIETRFSLPIIAERYQAVYEELA
jgi:glycosyltransferase involved in cell wall biosynthesis